MKTNNYKKIIEKAHDVTIFMAIPLIILALGSIFIGYFTKDLIIGLGNITFSNSIFDYIQEDITPKHDLNKIGDLERKNELLEKKYKEKDVLSSNDDEKLPEIKTTDSNFNNVIAENLVVNEENNTKETINTILTPALESKTKHIKRLIVFYSDNTFEELPKN